MPSPEPTFLRGILDRLRRRHCWQTQFVICMFRPSPSHDSKISVSCFTVAIRVVSLYYGQFAFRHTGDVNGRLNPRDGLIKRRFAERKDRRLRVSITCRDRENQGNEHRMIGELRASDEPTVAPDEPTPARIYGWRRHYSKLPRAGLLN